MVLTNLFYATNKVSMQSSIGPYTVNILNRSGVDIHVVLQPTSKLIVQPAFKDAVYNSFNPYTSIDIEVPSTSTQARYVYTTTLQNNGYSQGTFMVSPTQVTVQSDQSSSMPNSVMYSSNVSRPLYATAAIPSTSRFAQPVYTTQQSVPANFSFAPSQSMPTMQTQVVQPQTVASSYSGAVPVYMNVAQSSSMQPGTTMQYHCVATMMNDGSMSMRCTPIQQ